MEHVSDYNQMFSMTSFGAKINDSVNRGRGPYVFKVFGQIYYWIGSLCLEEGHHPQFLQVYIYDTQEEVANRMRNFRGPNEDTLNSETVKGLIRVLDEHNGLVRLFRAARDRCRAVSQTQAHRVRKIELATSIFQRCTMRTHFDINGYTHYQRRQTEGHIMKGESRLDNYNVVLYNRMLCMAFHAHINVEYSSWSMLIKYLFKYISKGPDRILAKINRPIGDASTLNGEKFIQVDEIQNYVDDRFIFPFEACWRIFDFPIHSREPAVQILNVHLENTQRVNFCERDRLDIIVNMPDKKTTLIEWYVYNNENTNGKHLTYLDFPSEFVRYPNSKSWHRRVWIAMKDDILAKVSESTSIINYHVNTPELQGYILYELEAILNGFENYVKEFGLPPPPERIACLLLPAGRTAHSRFKLPLDLTDESIFHAKKHSQLANLLVETYLIIWDEAPMNDRRCFEALHRTLRDLMNAPEILFGGKTMVLGGNFRLLRSDLGNKERERSVVFAKWLFDVGNSEICEPDEENNEDTSWITIPQQYCLTPAAIKSSLLRQRLKNDISDTDSDIIPSGDANAGQKCRRKVDIESLDGNVVEFTMWDDLAKQFNKDEIEKLPRPIIIVVSSCHVSKYKVSSHPETFYYINPRTQEAVDADTMFKEKYNLNPPLQVCKYRYVNPKQEKTRNR
nr:DNA helicase [Tanacetum cinerariifolium]